LRVGAIVVPADEAFSAWSERTSAAPATGLWPVILGDQSFLTDDELARFIDSVTQSFARPAAELLDDAVELDAEGLLADWLEDTEPLDEDALDPEAWESHDEAMPAGAVSPISSSLVPDSGLVTIALVR